MLTGTVLQSDVASNRFEGAYSGLVKMSPELLEVSLSLDRLNSSYSESPRVITISGGSTLSTGEVLATSELVLHDFAGFDGDRVWSSKDVLNSSSSPIWNKLYNQ